MTEAQRHQILLDLLAQTGFVTVEQVMSRARDLTRYRPT
ncbi:Ascorbate utilization transcriptional regulator UlaR [Klebsiella pneumoniae]|uniref:Ascorbate utilization transcriptional regulator UlaR n=1 Tax=Klebsiella pneumoniae TaxID=573 RepID=A0A378B757_KLEPN|nr:Ascorbate utilization transcriptional regulator UlaR [Klebsiella pneumoniae]